MAAENSCRQNGGRKNGNNDVPRPFLIGVAGGTASGKSTVCERIMQQLGQHEVEQKQRQVFTISMDSFYRELGPEDQLRARKGQYNFDHPNAFDEDLIFAVLNKIKNGETVEIPRYDMVEHKRQYTNKQTIYPADVVLVEGILTFYFKDIRDHFHMKLFVDTDADTRLSRRVVRDAALGRDIDQILYQYTTFVKPAFEEFYLPSKKYADVIIPRGADNHVAIELIVQHIQDLLRPTKSTIQKRTRTNSDSLADQHRREQELRLTSIEERANHLDRYKSAH